MKYRTLGKTGLEVSVVGVGTWQFGGEWGQAFDQPQADRILGRARELGINLIDTAECYGDHYSETLVGNAIQGNRQDWVVATKFGHKFHGNFERTDHWSPQEVVGQLEDSLRALRTDYIDLYQFHSGKDEVFNNEDLWVALAEQVRLGKIRHVGLSISPNDNIYQVDHAAWAGAKAVQVIYNRLDRVPEEAVLPSCQSQNLGVLARVPLASGLLSGKYKPGDHFTVDSDIRSRRDDAEIQDLLRQVEEIRQNELPEGVPMSAWALAWCLRHPAVTSVIPGCKSVEQVESNALAAAI